MSVKTLTKKEATKIIDKLCREISMRYFAPEEYIRRVLAACLAQSNIFQESYRGKGKTTLAGLFSAAFGVESGKVSGNPGMDESMYIGSYNLGKLVNAGIEEVRWKHFIMKAKVKCFEEFNRQPPHSVNALMPILSDEKTAFYGDQQLQIPRHVFIASANPPGPGSEGTWLIDSAVKDRFDYCFVPPRLTRRQIESLTLKLNDCKTPMPKISTEEELDAITDLVEGMEFDSHALLIASVAVAGSSACKHGEKEGLKCFPGCCKECEFSQGENFCSLVQPLSPRVVVSSVKKMAAALALMDGCEKVFERHVLEALPHALYHRIEFVMPNDEVHREQEIAMFIGKVTQKAAKIRDIVTTPIEKWTKAELNRLTRSRDPLIVEEALAIQATLGPVKQTVESMSASELAAYIKDGSAKAEDLMLAEAYLAEHKLIRIACTMEDADTQRWWENFVNQENEMLLSPAGWEYLMADHEAPRSQSIDGVHFTMEMVDKENAIIIIEISDATSADEIRDILVAKQLEVQPIVVDREKVLAAGAPAKK